MASPFFSTLHTVCLHPSTMWLLSTIVTVLFFNVVVSLRLPTEISTGITSSTRDRNNMLRPSQSTDPNSSDPNHMSRPSRRQFASSLSLLLLSQPSLPVHATQPRNEALCGTGFFTNFMPEKCTDLGDITEDGAATKMSSKELDQTSSLLDKLGVSEDSSPAPPTSPPPPPPPSDNR